MPWKVLQSGEPGKIVEQLIHDNEIAKIQSLSSTTIELISAYLGRSKESIDEIELSIPLLLPIVVPSMCDLSTQTKWTKTSSECICYVDGIAMTAVPTKTSWETDKTQLLRLTLQCNTRFAVRNKNQFPSDEVDHSGVYLLVVLLCRIALSRQVSRHICERPFLWRPNWAPVLCSKVPTHMFILCLFYARRWCNSSSVLGAHKIRTVSSTFFASKYFLYLCLLLCVLVFASICSCVYF